MDVIRESNVYDIEAHRKLDNGRRAQRTAGPAGESSAASTAWYHGDAIEADRRGSIEERPSGHNVVPLRH